VTRKIKNNNFLMGKLLLFLTLLLFAFNPAFAQYKIALAFPLMESSTDETEKTEAEFFLKGAKDALDDYKSGNPKTKIELKIGDTGKDPESAFNLIQSFALDDKVLAVLGPVFSGQLRALAPVAVKYKIPVISPTATQNGIASDNEYLFQLNPTYEVRGKLIAKYAFEELGFRNFAVFSEAKYGKNFADAFIAEIESRNGNILDTIYYQPAEVNLLEKFALLKSNILMQEKFIDFGNLNAAQREKLGKMSFNYSDYNSLVAQKSVVSIYKLLGKNAEKILDSLQLPSFSYNEKFKQPIIGIVDAIYMPISSASEINKLVSQYHGEGFTIPIIGTSDWNNAKAITDNAVYIPSLYYESDFYIEDKIKAEELESLKLNSNELKNYLFAYDGVKLLLDLIAAGNLSRNTLYNALSQVQNYSTFHNNITISDRTNASLSIIYYNKGTLQKLSNYIY
jgi:ABC-type branched-subunit amino acid transport system substrate-binding protein